MVTWFCCRCGFRSGGKKLSKETSQKLWRRRSRSSAAKGKESNSVQQMTSPHASASSKTSSIKRGQTTVLLYLKAADVKRKFYVKKEKCQSEVQIVKKIYLNAVLYCSPLVRVQTKADNVPASTWTYRKRRFQKVLNISFRFCALNLLHVEFPPRV